MTCPNCGQTARPELARCGHCNVKLPEQAQPLAGPASELVACWNCAQPNPWECVRCAHCNAKCKGQDGQPAAGNRFSFTQHAVNHDE